MGMGTHLGESNSVKSMLPPSKKKLFRVKIFVHCCFISGLHKYSIIFNIILNIWHFSIMNSYIDKQQFYWEWVHF